VKTDKRDARKIASLLESGEFSACRVPDQERREDRQIARTLDAVDKGIKGSRNRIRKLLQFHGIDPGIEKKTWSKGDFRRLKHLAVSESLRIALEVLLEMLELQWQQRSRLYKELQRLRTKPRYAKAVKIAQSFPGIGWLTAIRLVLELGEDIATFKSGKSLAAFLGLTGREHSTGETVRRGHLTNLGSKRIRSWMVESAWTAICRDPVLQKFYERVKRNCGSGKKAIVAVARKLTVRLYSCMKLETPYVLGVIE
jgi:transposase